MLIKRFIPLAVILFQIHLIGGAQIIIDERFNPAIGDSVLMYSTQYQHVLNTDGYQIWNYSNLEKRDSSISRVIPVSQSPKPGSFPEAEYYISGDNLGRYMSHDLFGQYAYGIYQEVNAQGGTYTTEINYSSEWKMTPFPLNYGDSGSSSIDGTITMLFPGYAYTGTREEDYSYAYKGYGRLILPDTTLDNVALFKIKQKITDSVSYSGFADGIYKYDVTTYSWMINEIFVPVLSFMEMDLMTDMISIKDTTTIYNAAWASFREFEESSSIYNTAQNLQTRIYPTPADDVLQYHTTCQSPQQSQITLCTLEGRLMKVLYSGRLSSGEHHLSLNIADIKPGLYLLNDGKNHYKVIID